MSLVVLCEWGRRRNCHPLLSQDVAGTKWGAELLAVALDTVHGGGFLISLMSRANSTWGEVITGVN